MKAKLVNLTSAALQISTPRQSNFIHDCFRRFLASWILPLLLLMAPAMVQAQFNFVTNNGAITITKYTGTNTVVVIPGTTNGYPVTSIGFEAFFGGDLTSVTIPNGVTSLGIAAFEECWYLISVTLPDSITNIAEAAFGGCISLTNVMIPNSVTSIGDQAFTECFSLTSVTIPNRINSILEFTFQNDPGLTNVMIPNCVTSIGEQAFFNCTNLISVYFTGNAPTADATAFKNDTNVTLYYLPGTTGWGTSFPGLPKALWFLPTPMILDARPGFGVQTNRFGFIISGATNNSVVVETCTNLATPIWSSVWTNILTNAWSYFSDPAWTNYPSRFYRLR
jgi:hypothetical protein